MKKTMALVLALVLLLGCTAAVAEEAFDASQFTTWFEEEGVWRTVTNDTSAQEGGTKGGFITDASGAPTKEDLEAIPSGSVKAMQYCHDVLIPDMTAVREVSDQLEELTASSSWPFPVYSDLLFYV